MIVDSNGAIEFRGEENVTTYSSRDWVARGFCKKCGTHLFYRLKDKDFCNFSMGTIDGHEDFKFHVQIFVDNKPVSYAFSNETLMMT